MIFPAQWYGRIALLLLCASTYCDGSARGDELYCPTLTTKDLDLTSLLAFNADDFCNAIAQGFKIGQSACVNGHIEDDSGWVIATTKDKLGYHDNYSLLLIGPSDRLGGYAPGGFEKYRMRVVTFIGLNCKAAYYSVIYNSMYHTGSFSEARRENDHNWKAFELTDDSQRTTQLMDYVGQYVIRNKN